MSYIVREVYNEGVNRTTLVKERLAFIIADDAASLPTDTTDMIYVMGSEALTIDTGNKYIKNSSGSWILQPNSMWQNVYTKQEIDAMITDVDADISDLFANQYIHDSIQVNLNDITWARSGGGLYYSQAIQIPNSPITKIYHATLSGFANIRETDNIIPAVRRSAGWSGFGLYANTGTFASGAWVTVSVSGIA